jgi:hypothetical protein
MAQIFWFTNVRARLGHARIANHHGCCPPDCTQPHGSTFTHFLSTRICSNRVCLFGSTCWRYPNPGRPFVRYPIGSPSSSMMCKGTRLPGTGRRPRQSRGSARPGGGTTALTSRCTTERRDPLTRWGSGLAGWAQLEFRQENIDGDRGAISYTLEEYWRAVLCCHSGFF